MSTATIEKDMRYSLERVTSPRGTPSNLEGLTKTNPEEARPASAEINTETAQGPKEGEWGHKDGLAMQQALETQARKHDEELEAVKRYTGDAAWAKSCLAAQDRMEHMTSMKELTRDNDRMQATIVRQGAEIAAHSQKLAMETGKRDAASAMSQEREMESQATIHHLEQMQGSLQNRAQALDSALEHSKVIQKLGEEHRMLQTQEIIRLRERPPMPVDHKNGHQTKRARGETQEE